jgi:biopolymer transport protein ExbB
MKIDKREVDPDMIETLLKKRRFWKRAIWISIVGIVVPPMFGLLGTVVGMMQAFSELSTTGQADPEAIAGDVSVALVTTMWGLTISLCALFFLIIAVIRIIQLPKPIPFDAKPMEAEQGMGLDAG